MISPAFKQKFHAIRKATFDKKSTRQSIFLLTAVAGLLVIPNLAHAQFGSGTALNFPILDDLFCGFISYSKHKLAPYVAVSAIIAGVIGHWLGATKIWGTLLYVALGIGLIMGIGVIIGNATGAAATCLSSSY